jgi:tetratricopeptide (TPR) repeat protein
MPEGTSHREDLAKAIALIRKGRSEQAIPLLDRLLELDPSCPLALRERGFAKSFRGDHAGAIADFTAFIVQRPADPDGYARRASARARAGDLQGAIEDYSTAISGNPQHPYAFLQRGRMRAASGDWSGAVSDFTVDMQHSNAGRLSGLLNRGRAKHRIGDLTGAIEDLSEAMRLEVGLPIYAPLYRGRVRLDMGDCWGAIADFTAAVEAYPQLTNAYRHRAEARGLVGDQKGAEEDLRSYKRLGGRDLPAYE